MPMWFLPSFIGDDGTLRRWPLTEHTAEQLISALIADQAGRVKILREAFVRDPVLAEWIVCRAVQRGGPNFENANVSAEWLAEHLAEELTWHSAEEFSVVLPNEKRSRREPFEQLPQLAAKIRELESLQASFARQLEHLKLEALKNFAYGAGHELNNPLANIATRAQTLLKEESNPERRRRLAAINAQAFRAHEMIADLMLFARPPKLVREPIQLESLIENLLAKVSSDATAQNTKLIHHRKSTTGGCEISGDPVQLTVALRAIIVNALEAVGHDGQVDVSIEDISIESEPTSLTPPFVHIIIRDSGPGISPDARSHIFDPFYSGREAGRGLGFGLCKAWRIITDHGGRIDVESPPGSGAVFNVILLAG